MKKLILLFLFTIGSFAQNSTEKKQVKLQVEFKNKVSDTLKIYGKNKFLHIITPNSNGVFESSFEITNGFHQISDGNMATVLYLKNGFDLFLKIDTTNKEKIFSYEGNGSKENNYLVDSSAKDELFETSGAFELEKEAFTSAFDAYKKESFDELAKQSFDEDFSKAMNMMKNQYFQYVPMMYDEVQLSKKLKGTLSPTFDYENHAGGKTSLESLKGKYVYIDVWATWCGPCRQEIPHLKKIEEKFHGKDIEFVSISVDAMKDHEKWKKFVTDNNLGGIQLFADNDWKSQFVEEYNIQGIPRFILIDKEGKVVEASAPRPSSPALEEQLNSLLQ